MEQNDNDKILVDIFVLGRYRGQKKVSRNSLIGKIATGDVAEIAKLAAEMGRELELSMIAATEAANE